MGHFLFGLISVRVSTAVVNGVPRMGDGRILGLDEHALVRRAMRESAALWKRFRRGTRPPSAAAARVAGFFYLPFLSPCLPFDRDERRLQTACTRR